MEDRVQLDKILAYIKRRENMGKKVMDKDKEVICKKVQERWAEKVWAEYTYLKKAGFQEGRSLFLIAAYFEEKPDETITPLLRRLRLVMRNREDLISGGMIAASYYGAEELEMRIPVLEDGIRNLYEDRRCVEALTGSIMIADGGPAEVAKAIQWYMFLMKNGFDVRSCQIARLIGIVSVISSSPNLLGQELLKRTNEKMSGIDNKIVNENNRKEKAVFQEIFCEVACDYIKELQQKEQERIKRLDRTSYKLLTGEKNVTAADYVEKEMISLNGSNLLTGMHQEVDLLIAAIHFGI